MAVTSRGSSTLNPNAPLFIPLAYQQVEDFSPEWWNLVQSSPWFRDYWLRESYETFEDAESFADLFPESLEDTDEVDEFSELESQLEEALLQCSTAVEGSVCAETEVTQHFTDANEREKEVVLLKSLNGKPCKPKFEAKHCEKPPQIVNVKTSPRWIHQPREANAEYSKQIGDFARILSSHMCIRLQFIGRICFQLCSLEVYTANVN